MAAEPTFHDSKNYASMLPSCFTYGVGKCFNSMALTSTNRSSGHEREKMFKKVHPARPQPPWAQSLRGHSLTRNILHWPYDSQCTCDHRCPRDARSLLGISQHDTLGKPQYMLPNHWTHTADSPTQNNISRSDGERMRTPRTAFFNIPSIPGSIW